MGALEEIRGMQKQGQSEKQIIESLQEKGFSYKEISEALAQNKIKSAIEEPQIDAQQPELPALEAPQEELQVPQESNIYQKDNFEPQAAGPAGMTKSLMVQSPESNQQMQEYVPAQMQDYGYTQQDQSNYPQYDYTSPALSADTITEISEQVVSERLSDVRKKMEKMMDFKTALEAKAESIEERLKRIERIIGTLQSSVLRKVGDYVTNVEDLKKELIQTQQTFTTIAPHLKKKKHSSPQQHHPQHNTEHAGHHHQEHKK